MTMLNFGGCDHEYIGQPGCVCDPDYEALAKRLDELAEPLNPEVPWVKDVQTALREAAAALRLAKQEQESR